MKTLKDEEYVVIKGYKFTVFEIWRDFNVLSYIARPRYPYIRVYRLYDYETRCIPVRNRLAVYSYYFLSHFVSTISPKLHRQVL